MLLELPDMVKESSLEGKTELITGGCRGIGKAIALVMAEARADVALAARTPGQLNETADEIRSLGRRAIPIKVDVTASNQVDAKAHKPIQDGRTICQHRQDVMQEGRLHERTSQKRY